MLEEVGASGQISLDKRLAGRRFDVVYHADGRIELLPTPAASVGAFLSGNVVDSWRPPGGYACAGSRWSRENREALEVYARDIERDGTAAQQLQRYLASGEVEAAQR